LSSCTLFLLSSCKSLTSLSSSRCILSSLLSHHLSHAFLSAVVMAIGGTFGLVLIFSAPNQVGTLTHFLTE
jgi:hypothetical protein